MARLVQRWSQVAYSCLCSRLALALEYREPADDRSIEKGCSLDRDGIGYASMITYGAGAVCALRASGSYGK